MNDRAQFDDPPSGKSLLPKGAVHPARLYRLQSCFRVRPRRGAGRCAKLRSSPLPTAWDVGAAQVPVFRRHPCRSISHRPRRRASTPP